MKLLIVDDEKPARDRLQQIVEDIDDVSVAGVAENGEQAVTASAGVDVVLLDIRMPGLNGIEAAHHINQLDDPPAIIFTTAYDEYAIDAFEARAIGYVLKPVRREHLKDALQQAARLTNKQLDSLQQDETLASPREQLCVRRQGDLHLVPISSIQAFIADQKYVRILHNDGEDLIDTSLKTLEEEFGDRLIRIHRNALVFVEQIEQIAKDAEGKQNVVVLRDRSDDNALVISRRHLADVRRRLRG